MQRYTVVRLIHYFFLVLARLPIPGHKRHYILRLAGIRFPKTDSQKYNIFIGTNVMFDTLAPTRISIGNNTLITSGTKILTHFYDPVSHKFSYGDVVIGSHVFIGVDTVICKPVTIGDGAVIGAGSVVTKNIPPYELWAGVPARFIKKLNL